MAGIFLLGTSHADIPPFRSGKFDDVIMFITIYFVKVLEIAEI